jgi:periplasmic divalent cation tolerance protein
MNTENTAPLVVLMTASSLDEARLIARSLVGERLAACCNILGQAESIYRWEGKVEEAVETMVVIKTDAAHFPRLEQRIRELHSYDVPEIIALPISAGSEAYLRWIRESLGNS